MTSFVSTPTLAALGDQLAKLTATDAAAGDTFGISAAINGNIAIVGAYSDDDAGSSSGSAYLFDVSTGNQIAKLTAADAATEDLFGYSVAVSGDAAIVGAYGDDDAGSMSGSAYLFDLSTPTQLRKLVADDSVQNDVFGFSVGISGNIAIVGAHGNSGVAYDSGSAYLFDVTTGNQLAKLNATDAGEGSKPRRRRGDPKSALGHLWVGDRRRTR